MHRTRLVRVSFVLLFTTAFGSSTTAQPGLLRKLDPPRRTRALLATGGSHVIISAPDPTSLSSLTPFVQGAGGRLTRSLPLVTGIAVDRPTVAASDVVVAADDGDTVAWGTSCSDPSGTPVIWNKS